ncbi:hypothetical protein [Kordia sp.]|uniref:hypothetical protein n=1 Tax=Kordia sp. TaxID=1965332 RepID=UPI003D294E90
MKKQNKVLKLKKSTISELNIEKAGEIIGGRTGAGAFCKTTPYDYNCVFISVNVVCEPSVNVC